MSANRQSYSVSYIFNGPHTIVSTMPNGYSVTLQGILTCDGKQQRDIAQTEDDSYNELSRYCSAKDFSNDGCFK